MTIYIYIYKIRFSSLHKLAEARGRARQHVILELTASAHAFLPCLADMGVSSWGSPSPVVSILSHDLILDDLGAPAF